jgi:RNA polymerase sigma-70 factor (ECF subfamily)
MEEACLELAKHGDEDAIRTLVDTYRGPVFGLCYRMLRRRTDAEDAAQEALVKAVTHLDSFELGRPFKPWVMRIASNECIDRIRRRKNPVSLDDMGEDGAWEWKAGESPNPEAEVLHKEKHTLVREMLVELKPLDRQVMALFYWQDMSYAEISELTGLTESAIKSRLYRARRKMAGLLVEEGIYA